MTAQVQHTPKAGAKLTGTEYEAADHHTVTGVALDDHNYFDVPEGGVSEWVGGSFVRRPAPQRTPDRPDTNDDDDFLAMFS